MSDIINHHPFAIPIATKMSWSELGYELWQPTPILSIQPLMWALKMVAYTFLRCVWGDNKAFIWAKYGLIGGETDENVTEIRALFTAILAEDQSCNVIFECKETALDFAYRVNTKKSGFTHSIKEAFQALSSTTFDQMQCSLIVENATQVIFHCDKTDSKKVKVIKEEYSLKCTRLELDLKAETPPSTVISVEETRHDLEDEIRELKSEIETLRAKNKSQSAMIRKNIAQRASLRADLKEARASGAKMSVGDASFSSEFTADLNSAIDASDERIMELKAMQSTQQDLFSSFSSLMELKKAEVMSLRQRIASLERELEFYKKDT